MEISTQVVGQPPTNGACTILGYVDGETKRIESRFLEPACGDSDVLVGVLERKLGSLNELYEVGTSDYEKMSVMAVSSLYGIELLEEKAFACREQLLSTYEKMCGNYVSGDTKASVSYLLERNIICGDMLTMETKSGFPIVLSEWIFSSGTSVLRLDYVMADVINGDKDPLFHYRPVRYDKIRISVPLIGD